MGTIRRQPSRRREQCARARRPAPPGSSPRSVRPPGRRVDVAAGEPLHHPCHRRRHRRPRARLESLVGEGASGRPACAGHLPRRLDVSSGRRQPGVLHADAAQRSAEHSAPDRLLPRRRQQPAAPVFLCAGRIWRVSPGARPVALADRPSFLVRPASRRPCRRPFSCSAGRRRHLRVCVLEALLRQPGPVQHRQQPVGALLRALAAADGAGAAPTSAQRGAGRPLFGLPGLGRTHLCLLSPDLCRAAFSLPVDYVNHRCAPRPRPALARIGPASRTDCRALCGCRPHISGRHRADPGGHAAGPARRRRFLCQRRRLRRHLQRGSLWLSCADALAPARGRLGGHATLSQRQRAAYLCRVRWPVADRDRAGRCGAAAWQPALDLVLAADAGHLLAVDARPAGALAGRSDSHPRPIRAGQPGALFQRQPLPQPLQRDVDARGGGLRQLGRGVAAGARRGSPRRDPCRRRCGDLPG